MKKTLPLLLVLVLALVGVAVWFAGRPTDADADETERRASGRPAPIAEVEPASAAAEGAEATEEATFADEESSDADAEPSEEEKAAAAEEKLVEDFDALTDRWMEPAKGGVTMADVADFVKRFKAIPKERQDECLHRALNLVPDDNVMLLAGILLDTSVDRDQIELVYNDILNRDEDVKKPILLEIFKDKTHPCWADTAWILDVTGERPAKE